MPLVLLRPGQHADGAVPWIRLQLRQTVGHVVVIALGHADGSVLVSGQDPGDVDRGVAFPQCGEEHCERYRPSTASTAPSRIRLPASGSPDQSVNESSTPLHLPAGRKSRTGG